MAIRLFINRGFKGLRPFKKFSSLSPYEGERDKGRRLFEVRG